MICIIMIIPRYLLLFVTREKEEEKKKRRNVQTCRCMYVVGSIIFYNSYCLISYHHHHLEYVIRNFLILFSKHSPLLKNKQNKRIIVSQFTIVNLIICALANISRNYNIVVLKKTGGIWEGVRQGGTHSM